MMEYSLYLQKQKSMPKKKKKKSKKASKKESIKSSNATSLKHSRSNSTVIAANKSTAFNSRIEQSVSQKQIKPLRKKSRHNRNASTQCLTTKDKLT